MKLAVSDTLNFSGNTPRTNIDKSDGEYEPSPRLLKLYRDGVEKVEQQRLGNLPLHSQYTFQPHIATSPDQHTRPGPGTAEQVSKRLYKPEYVQMLSEGRAKRKEEEEMKECTFQPHIRQRNQDNKMGEMEVTSVSSATGNVEKLVGKFEKLYKDASTKKERRERMNKQKLIEDMKECSFRPNINIHHQKHIAARGGTMSSGEKLFKHAGRIDEKRKEMAEKKKEDEMKTAHFNRF